jgi:hypothetical protein
MLRHTRLRQTELLAQRCADVAGGAFAIGKQLKDAPADRVTKNVKGRDSLRSKSLTLGHCAGALSIVWFVLRDRGCTQGRGTCQREGAIPWLTRRSNATVVRGGVGGARALGLRQ